MNPAAYVTAVQVLLRGWSDVVGSIGRAGNVSFRIDRNRM